VKLLARHAHVRGKPSRTRTRSMKALDRFIEPSFSAETNRQQEPAASPENKPTLKQDLLITTACAALIIAVLAWCVLQ
jgi:hypothetical protein